MGYNRPGAKRKLRLKRAKRHEERLFRKAQAAEAEANRGTLTKIKDAVVSAAESVVDAVRGKK